MAARPPKNFSLVGQVKAETKQIDRLVDIVNSTSTTRKEAAIFLASAMQHIAKCIDLLRVMGAGLNPDDTPEWFDQDQLHKIPRP